MYINFIKKVAYDFRFQGPIYFCAKILQNRCNYLGLKAYQRKKQLIGIGNSVQFKAPEIRTAWQYEPFPEIPFSEESHLPNKCLGNHNSYFLHNLNRGNPTPYPAVSG